MTTDNAPAATIIDTIYAVIGMDENGAEGIVAMHKQGSWFPMVAGDQKMADYMWEQALSMEGTKETLRLIRLSTRDVLKERIRD